MWHHTHDTPVWMGWDGVMGPRPAPQPTKTQPTKIISMKIKGFSLMTLTLCFKNQWDGYEESIWCVFLSCEYCMCAVVFTTSAFKTELRMTHMTWHTEMREWKSFLSPKIAVGTNGSDERFLSWEKERETGQFITSERNVLWSEEQKTYSTAEFSVKL